SHTHQNPSKDSNIQCPYQDAEMKIGICKECFSDIELIPENEIEYREYSENSIYECKKCDYPNGIKCGDFWEIYEK
ncbi:MAG: hypothetical protein KGI05_09000, partial [Thaumarchaeota archaeon]|nr:hypothetical protein [Nitrososphaerota archaeon]